MGRKIFVSYKYADSDVKQFSDLNNLFRAQDTVRSYVTLLEEYFEERSEHVYKGEHDGEDISYLSEATIRDKLFSRIYDSTLTIVMISPNMQEYGKQQKDQWIPREISYSLREQSRVNSAGQIVTSSTNALLGVVLPDRNGSYSYFLGKCNLCESDCRVLNTPWLFKILRDNTFNAKELDCNTCNSRGSTVYHGESSYITYVNWADFRADPEAYIEKAYELRDNKDDYVIHVQL